jgi:hypothetical protein
MKKRNKKKEKEKKKKKENKRKKNEERIHVEQSVQIGQAIILDKRGFPFLVSIRNDPFQLCNMRQSLLAS